MTIEEKYYWLIKHLCFANVNLIETDATIVLPSPLYFQFDGQAVESLAMDDAIDLAIISEMYHKSTVTLF